MREQIRMSFPVWGSIWGVVMWALLIVGLVSWGTQKDGTTVVLPEPPLSLSVQRDSIVAQEARRAGVNVRLAIAVSHVENHSGDSMAVSSAGAIGLMQVLPSIWQHAFEDECGCGSLYRRQRNACVGVRVLDYYLKQHKRIPLALRAYHGSLKLHAIGDEYIEAVLTRMTRQPG